MAKIILIAHQKGGVGKSTLAFNIALKFGKYAKVGVLDFDLQGSLTQLKNSIVYFDVLDGFTKIEGIEKLPYDFVIIDTPPYLSINLKELIRIADLVVVPTKAGVFDLLAIRGTIDLITKEDAKAKSIIVFNMVKANTNLTDEIMIGVIEYGVSVAKTHMSDLVSYTRSVLLGGLQGKAQQQMDTLTEELLIRII